MSFSLFQELEMAELSCRLVRLQVMLNAHRKHKSTRPTWFDEWFADWWWHAVYHDEWFDESVCREGMSDVEIREELLNQRETLELHYHDLRVCTECDSDWW